MHKSTETLIKLRAKEFYDTLSDNHRVVVSYGMLPLGKTIEAERALLAEIEKIEGEYPDEIAVARVFAVGVFDAANAGTEKMRV